MELKLINDTFEVIHPDGNWRLKKDAGFSPLETLVIAIAGCSASVYKNVLTNSRIEHTFHNITVDYTRVEDGKAMPLKSVTITFYLKDVPASQQEKTVRATHLISRNCPVVQSLDPSIQVIENVEFI